MDDEASCGRRRWERKRCARFWVLIDLQPVPDPGWWRRGTADLLLHVVAEHIARSLEEMTGRRCRPDGEAVPVSTISPEGSETVWQPDGSLR
jgi:hypothetical protein